MKVIPFIAFFILSFIDVSGQDNSITFNDQYIKKNNGKVSTEIHEVQELTYIIMAISDYGLMDSNMINHNSTYYKNVIQKFEPYRNHRIVKIVDSLLNESLIYNIFLSSNAYGFKFEGDDIKRTWVYTFPAQGIGAIEISEDPVEKYLKEFKDFAKKSEFRSFYRSQSDYYKSIQSDYAKFAQIDKQKKWLENKFDYKIPSYKVLTSGLIGGINATNTFENNNFKEMLLYLPTIKNNPEWSNDYNTAMTSRVIFTEIDHNYVGPVSELFKNKIDTIFDNRNIWVDSTNKSTNHYPNPIKVFDEYLTWGLFILYIHDTFPGDSKLLDEVILHINSKMKTKGFPKSKEFNETLFSLYKRDPKMKITALYDDLLNWAVKEN